MARETARRILHGFPLIFFALPQSETRKFQLRFSLAAMSATHLDWIRFTVLKISRYASTYKAKFLWLLGQLTILKELLLVPREARNSIRVKDLVTRIPSFATQSSLSRSPVLSFPSSAKLKIEPCTVSRFGRGKCSSRLHALGMRSQ